MILAKSQVTFFYLLVAVIARRIEDSGQKESFCDIAVLKAQYAAPNYGQSGSRR
jgi:hypothetical protein